MIRTIAVVLFLALALLLVMPLFILWTLLTGTADLMYEVAMKTVRASLRIAKIRVRVEGLENIPPSVCIFAANHISNVDPIAFVPAIPRRVSVLLKSELFRIPILSTAMRLAKFVPVDRADKEAAVASVNVALGVLKEGLSLAVYPEGTRSPDGRLRPFKKGTFALAIEAGVPIVPVSISGAQHLMRKGEWTMRPGETVVRFGPPVDASQYTMERRMELLARVEELVAAGLPEDQQPLSVADHADEKSQAR
ncbi:MAG TPA: lysophospholipid acyltransferase family protein [Candidatus Dormibacteraeota bacterium]|nr:lysophospholipid acyltransferase family protein [Candidatus Dormibacteraeota bacterium]